MSTPFVSVIIVNFNGADLLPACLDAVFSSSYGRKNFEVIVVDNNSTDDSISLLATFYPAVRLLKFSNNRGFGAANNAGANIALGEVLLFLNTDTIVSTTWMEELVQKVMEKGVGAVNPKVLLPGKPTKVQNAGITVFATGGARDRGALVSLDKKQDYEVDSSFFDTATEIPAVCGVSMAIRKDVFTKVGGFSSLFFFYYEDVDLSLRLRRLGYSLLFEPKATLLHLHAATSKQDSLFFLRWSEQGMMTCTYLHYPLSACLFVTKNYLMRIGASLLRALLFLCTGRIQKATMWRKRTQIRLQVFFSVIARLGTLLRQRATLAQQEKRTLAQLYETFI